MKRDKNQRLVGIYFETVEDKKKFERDAARYNLSMNKLALMAIQVGKPVVMRSLRAMKKQTEQAKQASKEVAQ